MSWHCDVRFREHRRLQSETIQTKRIRVPEREAWLKLRTSKKHSYSQGNFVSPLIQIQSAFDPELSNEFPAHSFVNKPMRVGIVGSRRAP
jgi:hypothetical protein